MNPESSPSFSVKNAGSSLRYGLTRRSIRRSETLAISERAMPRKSREMAMI